MPAFSLTVVVLYASLSPDRKATLLALERALTSPFIQAFWLENDFIVFVIATYQYYIYLLMYDVTVDVYSSRSMWCESCALWARNTAHPLSVAT